MKVEGVESKFSELLGRGAVDEYNENTLNNCMKFSNNKNIF